MSFYLKVDTSRLKKKLSELEKQQMPFAIAKSMTDTAVEAKEAIKREMQRVFDRPTAYTLNSTYVIPAKKHKLKAAVRIKDKSHKAIAPVKYLGAEVEGGIRNFKKSEMALKHKGVLPDGKYIVPGQGVKLDRHGNVSGSAMVQILSAMGAFLESGYVMNRAKKLKKHRAFFVPKPGSKLAAGIWERTKSGIKPILVFVKAPVYRQRLLFYKVAQKVADTRFKDIFRANLIHAIKTAITK